MKCSYYYLLSPLFIHTLSFLNVRRDRYYYSSLERFPKSTVDSIFLPACSSAPGSPQFCSTKAASLAPNCRISLSWPRPSASSRPSPSRCGRGDTPRWE